MTELKDKTILITGADGGLGTALVIEFIARNVKKIYATGLKLDNLKRVFEKFADIVVPIELDVTNTESIQKCADLCSDTEILVNNAGVEFKVPFIADKSSQAA